LDEPSETDPLYVIIEKNFLPGSSDRFQRTMDTKYVQKCGMPIVIVFNHEFEFIADHLIAGEVSQTIADIMTGDSAANRIPFDIPTTDIRSYKLLENYLRIGRLLDKITADIWSELFACVEKLQMTPLRKELCKYFKDLTNAKKISEFENFSPSFIPSQAIKELISFDAENFFVRAVSINPNGCWHNKCWEACSTCYNTKCKAHYTRITGTFGVDNSNTQCFHGTSWDTCTASSYNASCTQVYAHCYKDLQKWGGNFQISDWFTVFKKWLDRYVEMDKDAWIWKALFGAFLQRNNQSLWPMKIEDGAESKEANV